MSRRFLRQTVSLGGELYPRHFQRQFLQAGHPAAGREHGPHGRAGLGHGAFFAALRPVLRLGWLADRYPKCRLVLAALPLLGSGKVDYRSLRALSMQDGQGV